MDPNTPRNPDQWLTSLLSSFGLQPDDNTPAPTLHRSHDLRAIHPGQRHIYLTATTQDADRLWSANLPATTPTGGLTQWQPAHAELLHGHDIVIIIPPGDSGLDLATCAAVDLQRRGCSVRVILWENTSAEPTISAWLDNGGQPSDLDELARTTKPVPSIADLQAKLANPRPSAVVTRLSTVTPRAVEWLWQGWLPLGKLAILGGHPGVGKSTLAAAIAATLSVAAEWPDGTTAPLANTIFLLAEDAADDTLRPRLDQLGADPTRILTLDAVSEGDGAEVYFNLGKHLDALEDAILEADAQLVIIDPLSAFLPRRNRNDEGDIRDLLTPLARLAARLDIAVLAIMHVGKQSSGRTALQSLLGTTAFGAIARSVIMAAPIPNTGHNALAVVKSNLSKTPPPLAWSRPLDGPILWHGPTPHSMETLLSGLVSSSRLRPRDDAETFLREILFAGPVPTSEVEQAAVAEGISIRTLNRARRMLGVTSQHIGGKAGTWYLTLPTTGRRGGSPVGRGARHNETA